VEVVEGFKEGYESDVLEPEMSMSPAEDDNKKKVIGVSDEEEDNTKESTNDSDEDFNIDNYVACCNKDSLETTAESSSIRYSLRKIRSILLIYETYFILNMYLAFDTTFLDISLYHNY